MGKVFCVFVCVLLSVQIVLCQFGFFQQRNDHRSSNFAFGPFNPQTIRNSLHSILGKRREDTNRNIQNPNNPTYPYNPSYPNNQGYSNNKGYLINQGYPPNQEYYPNQGYPINQGYPTNQGYPNNQNYPYNRPVVFPTINPEERPNNNDQSYPNNDQPYPNNDQNYPGNAIPDTGYNSNGNPVALPSDNYNEENNGQEVPEIKPLAPLQPVEAEENQGFSKPEEATQDPYKVIIVEEAEDNYGNNQTIPNYAKNFGNGYPQQEDRFGEDLVTTLLPLTAAPTSSPKSFNYGSPGIFTETCQTVENEVGNCIGLTQCEPYLKVVKTAGNNQAAVQLLRKAHCGFEGNNPKVCCPLPELPTVPETTTTTTSAPTPAQGKTVNLADFPEPPVCGVSNASFSRVVGGVNAKLGDFPWMALLGYTGRQNPVNWKCGGSLITSRHVLTAAHCIHNQEDKLFVVRLGELDLAREDDGAAPVDVLIKTMTKHEDYNPTAFTNDIGMLVLEKEVQFNDLIRPICMPKDTELRSRSYENYNPLIAGWGSIEFRGPSATHLQVLQLPVVTNSFCEKAYSAYKAQKIDQRVLCAGFEKGGRDACQGDSGGPLMQPIWNSKEFTTYFYQIGVVSYGKKCAEAGFPGVYTRVTHFIPWIQEKIKT